MASFLSATVHPPPQSQSSQTSHYSQHNQQQHQPHSSAVFELERRSAIPAGHAMTATPTIPMPVTTSAPLKTTIERPICLEQSQQLANLEEILARLTKLKSSNENDSIDSQCDDGKSSTAEISQSKSAKHSLNSSSATSTLSSSVCLPLPPPPPPFSNMLAVLPDNEQQLYSLFPSLSHFQADVAALKDRQYDHTNFLNMINQVTGSVKDKKISKKLEKQQAAVWELIFTEINYIRNLMLLVQIYVCTYDSLKTEFFESLDVDDIFNNLKCILEANLDFWFTCIRLPLCSVLSSPSSPTVSIATTTTTPVATSSPNKHPISHIKTTDSRQSSELFFPIISPSAWFQGFSDIEKKLAPYLAYCAKMKQFQEKIKKLVANNVLFRNFLQWAEGLHTGYREKFRDQLAKPFQRLTKYRPIFETIFKNTEDDTEKLEMETIFQKLTNFLMTINEEIRKTDMLENLAHFEANLEPLERPEVPVEFSDDLIDLQKDFSTFSLTQPMKVNGQSKIRQLIQKGTLRFKEGQQKHWIDVVLLLFTDCLLITRIMRKNRSKMQLYKPAIRLDKISLRLINANVVAFGLLGDFNELCSFGFFTASKKIIDDWVIRINSARNAYLNLIGQNMKSSGSQRLSSTSILLQHDLISQNQTSASAPFNESNKTPANILSNPRKFFANDYDGGERPKTARYHTTSATIARHKHCENEGGTFRDPLNLNATRMKMQRSESSPTNNMKDSNISCQSNRLSDSSSSTSVTTVVQRSSSNQEQQYACEKKISHTKEDYIRRNDLHEESARRDGELSSNCNFPVQTQIRYLSPKIKSRPSFDSSSSLSSFQSNNLRCTTSSGVSSISSSQINLLAAASAGKQQSNFIKTLTRVNPNLRAKPSVTSIISHQHQLELKSRQIFNDSLTKGRDTYGSHSSNVNLRRKWTRSTNCLNSSILNVRVQDIEINSSPRQQQKEKQKSWAENLDINIFDEDEENQPTNNDSNNDNINEKTKIKNNS